MDKLFINVLERIVEKEKVSIADIQRVFKIGFTRAVNILKECEQQGYIIWQAEGYKINICKEQLKELQAKTEG